MDHIFHYDSPLGGITVASDGEVITGLWFDGQKYFGASLPESFLKENGLADALGKNAEVIADSIQYKEENLPVFEQTKRWLDLYFAGKDPGFTPPLNIEPGRNRAATEFRKEVWEILLTIPYGQTVTYKDIAEKISEKKEECDLMLKNNISDDDSSGNIAPDKAKYVRAITRAIGGAVGHNPISLIIPCHRVIGSDGSLTGYAGGIDKKITLLKMEGSIL